MRNNSSSVILSCEISLVLQLAQVQIRLLLTGGHQGAAPSCKGAAGVQTI